VGDSGSRGMAEVSQPYQPERDWFRHSQSGNRTIGPAQDSPSPHYRVGIPRMDYKGMFKSFKSREIEKIKKKIKTSKTSIVPCSSYVYSSLFFVHVYSSSVFPVVVTSVNTLKWILSKEQWRWGLGMWVIIHVYLIHYYFSKHLKLLNGLINYSSTEAI